MEPLIQQQFTDTARRDQRLLNLAYRRARRMGDYRGALQAATMGDQMGLRVGTSGNDQELKGTGFQRMRNAFAMNGMGVPATGLDAFDFRHSNQGGPGVGGFNFNQRRFQGDPAPIQNENLNPDQNNPAETQPVTFGNPAQTQPVSQQKPSGFSATPEEVAQFQRERRIYGAGVKVPDLQKPSEQDQGIALRIAQRRNYLNSLKGKIDQSFGVPDYNDQWTMQKYRPRIEIQGPPVPTMKEEAMNIRRSAERKWLSIK